MEDGVWVSFRERFDHNMLCHWLCACACQELVVVKDTVGKAQSLSIANLPLPLTREVQ